MERRIDSGRLIIPAEMRRRLGIVDGTMMNLEVKGDELILKKIELYCAICSSSEDIRDVNGVRICQNCIDEIKNKKIKYPEA